MNLQSMKGMGMIRSTRGLVTILDQPRMEEIAGLSYGQLEAEYRDLIGLFGKQAA